MLFLNVKNNFSIYLLLLFFFSASITIGHSQEIIINNIFINGNKRTKERVIKRELTFGNKQMVKEGESINEIIEVNEKRLLSTGLFNKAELNFSKLEDKENTYDVFIEVNENWVLYPAPIFELADRNFNLWWYELGRDIKRVNYGVRLDHANLTGNRDKLVLVAQAGYTRKLELKYNFPFLDNEGIWNASFNAFYADVKEIAYKTVNNKTLFGSFNEEIMLTRFRLGGDIGYRQNLYLQHGFRLEYHNNNINNFAATELNPDYFLDGRTQNQFFFFNYTLFYDTRVFLLFPEGGNFFHLNLKKEGLYIFNDYNNLSLALEYEKYYSYSSKLIWDYRIKGKANLIRNKVAFANNTALGWGSDVLRGYEIYAIDGTDFIYSKMNVHYKFFENTYDLTDFIPIAQFNKIDIKLYGSLGFETGFVNERDYIESNSFNNRLLYGYGPTLSLMLYNSYLFQIDYSINHTGQGGIYVDSKISF